MKPFVDERIVRFHALAAGGESVGRDDAGKTVFAPFGASGDLARVRIDEDKSKFARGEIFEWIELGPHRIEPPCPYFRPAIPARSCGGCAWQHLELSNQREAKRQVVQNALERIGGFQIEVEECIGASGFGYRNKADFVVGNSEIGFFARSSHDLIDVETCPIQHPRNNEVLRAAREILANHPDWAFDARSGRGDLRRLVARVSSDGDGLATLVTAQTEWKHAAQFARELRERAPHLRGVLLRNSKHQVQTVEGENFLIEVVNELRFCVSGEGFWQINAELTPILARTALDWANLKRGERLLDLFCGAGLFALHGARLGAEVVGVERARGAIEDARFNAKQNDLRAQFFVDESARKLRDFKPNSFDVVLLDPPRAGARDAVADILRLAPSRIIYVSCDPATLARDAKMLASGGYELTRATSFDLFPQTAHVETLVRFGRGK